MAISGISAGPSNEYIPASEPMEEEAPVAEALPETEPEPAVTPIEDSSQLNQEAIAEDSSLTMEDEDHSHVDSMLDSLGSTDNFASGETSLEATVETLEEQVESASDRQLSTEEVGERLDQAEDEARKQLDQLDDPEKQAEVRAQLEKIEDLREQERDKEQRLSQGLLVSPPPSQTGPDTRFPGDLSKTAPVEEAKAPSEEPKSETPTPKTPLEWFHQRALQALGPQVERRPAPPAAERVEEVKPQTQPGFLASEVRRPGQPDMRLPGDHPLQARAELQPNETKAPAESPESGLKTLLFGKDAQAQLASRFDDLRSQFQLAFGKSVEYQPAPLPVPPPEVRRASGENVTRLASADKPEGLVESLKGMGARAYESVFGGEDARETSDQGLAGSLKELGGKAYDQLFGGGNDAKKANEGGLLGSLQEWGSKAYHSVFGSEDSRKSGDQGLIDGLKSLGAKAYDSLFGNDKAVQNGNGGLLGTLKDWGSNVYHSVFGGDKAVQNDNGGLLGTLKDWGSNVYHSVFGSDKAVQNDSGGLLGTLKEWGSNVYHSVFGGEKAVQNGNGGLLGTLKDWGSNVYHSVFGGEKAVQNDNGGLIGTLKDWGSNVYHSVFGNDKAVQNDHQSILGTLKEWGSHAYNSVFGGGDSSRNTSDGIVGTLKEWGSQVYNSVFGGGDTSKTDQGGLVGTLKEWGPPAKEVPPSDSFARSGEQVQPHFTVLSSLGSLADRSVAGAQVEGLSGWAQQAARAPLSDDPSSTFQGLAASAAQLSTASLRGEAVASQLLDNLSQVAHSAASGKVDLNTALSQSAETIHQLSTLSVPATSGGSIKPLVPSESAPAQPLSTPEVASTVTLPNPESNLPGSTLKAPSRLNVAPSATTPPGLEAESLAHASPLQAPPAMLKPLAHPLQLIPPTHSPSPGKDSGLPGAPGPLPSAPSIGTESRNSAGGGGSFWLRRNPEPQQGPATALPPESSTPLAAAQRLAVQPPASVAQSATPNQPATVGESEERGQVGERRRLSRLGRIFAPMQQDQQHEQARSGQEREAHKAVREEREKDEKQSTKAQRQQESEQQRKQQHQQQLQRQVQIQRKGAGKKEEAARQRPRQQAGHQAKEGGCCGQCGHHLEGEGSACPICATSARQPHALLTGTR